MILKDFFINLCIFSFLVSTAVVIRVFTTNKSCYTHRLFGGVYAGIIAAILMHFPFNHNGLIYDIRFIPLILSFVYFGHRAGWITAVIMFTTRIYIGGNWIIAGTILAGTILLYTLFRTYFKNLPPIKNAFLHLAAYIGVYSLAVLICRILGYNLIYNIQYILVHSLGLIIGIMLIEAHNKMYKLIENLSQLNKELAESQQELKDTVHEQQGAIFKFKKVNERFIYTLFDGQDLYKNGVTPEYHLGKGAESVAPPDLVPHILQHYQLAWEGRETTYEITLTQGKTYFVMLRPIIRDGQVIEVVGSSSEITERKKVEEELRATKERLESLIKYTADPIGIVDLEGNVLQINKAFEEMFGWSQQEVVGQILPFVPDFLMEEAKNNFQKVISSGKPIIGWETVRQRKDRSFIDISITISPIEDSNGNMIAVTGICIDISKRKQNERELRRLHRQNELILQSVGEGMYGIDQNGKISFMNPSGAKMLGYSIEEVLNMHPGQFLHEVTPGNNQVFRRKDGTPLTVEYINTPIQENDQILGSVVTFRDITERLKTEELLRKSDRLSVIGQLSAGIAHEIRNPLTTLKGFMQLLKTSTNENNQWYIDLMLSEIDRIEGITNEFMMVAKPQAVHFEQKDIRILLEHVTNLLQPQAIMNDVELITEFESDIPLIQCEGNQLKQVFINILKNAVEAMPTGGKIFIQVCKVEDECVLIRCIDQGSGIPKERIPHLGEPFYSLKEKGTGLGLMISYKIIEDHQGKVFIESEINKGTIVDVVLPIQPQGEHILSKVPIK